MEVRFDVKLAQAFRHRTDVAVADEAVVDFNHAGEFAHGAGAEHFVGAVNVARQIGFDAADFFSSTDFDDGGASYSFGTGEDAAGQRDRFCEQ